jgi:hypothetical protein
MRTTILAIVLASLNACGYADCTDGICEDYPTADHVVVVAGPVFCAEVGSVADCGQLADDGTPLVTCLNYDRKPVFDCATRAIVANSGTDHSLCVAACR